MSYFHDVITHFWVDLVDRFSGPLKFRFIIQPVMATLLAIRDGTRDAHAGRTPYLWTIVFRRDRSKERLIEGLRAVSRLLVLGVVMDAIYQFLVLKYFHPLQMVVVVLEFAFIPYVIVRGPTRRIVRWHMHRAKHPDQPQSLPHG